MQAVLCEELSLKPYAGIFVVYMIDRFENLTDEQFKLWDTCNDNLYLQELKVLTKSNQTRFSKFILDYLIKHRDDMVRQEALKFIERLKELPEYEPIIEEGVEEAVQVGDEEVKFMRKDMLECREKGVAFLAEVVKFVITGNVKQLQKLVAEEKLGPLDFYDARGFAVKAFDPDQAIINTREWNPVHFAVYFRQMKTLQWLVDELGVNLRVALDHSHTYNEFVEDTSYRDVSGHLYGVALAVWAKDQELLKFLVGNAKLHLAGQDLLRLLRLCVQGAFVPGILALLGLPRTEKTFENASLDSKEEIVAFLLSDNCIESACLNSNKNQD